MSEATITQRSVKGSNLTSTEVDNNFLALRNRVPQLKTAAGWAAASTTVLREGQLGIETDTGLYRVGNGTSTWAQLFYAVSYMVQTTWALRPTTGLVDGQFGDFRATFGPNAPLFRWRAASSAWIPMGPVPLIPSATIGAGITITEGVQGTTETAALFFTAPAGLVRPGGQTRGTWLAEGALTAVNKTVRVKYSTTSSGTAGTDIGSVNHNSATVAMLRGDYALDHIEAARHIYSGDGWRLLVNPPTAAFTGTITTDLSNTEWYFKFTQQLAAGSTSITLRRAECLYYPGHSA